MGMIWRQMSGRGVAMVLAISFACMVPARASAQSSSEPRILHALSTSGRRFVNAMSVVPQETLAALSLTIGILVFAVVAAILYVRTRARLQLVERSAQEQIGELSARAERAEALLSVDQTILIIWPPADGDPEVQCNPGSSRVLPARRADALAFGKWLEADSALELERLVAALRSRGESFNVMLRTRSGDEASVHIEADGRSVGGRAVLRLHDLADQRRELAEFYDHHKRVTRDMDSLRALLNAVPIPAWLRDRDGQVVWSNRAYGRTIGVASSGASANANALTDEAAWRQLDETRDADGTAHCKLALHVGGQERIHDVWDVSGDRVGAGIAIDSTEIEQLRGQLATRDGTHGRTLDQVRTAVAVFGADRRLVFYNRSFRQLWGFDDTFLGGRPGFDEILDRLRAAGRLQEPVDYRSWRDDQLAIFDSPVETQASESTRQTLWHLPDGRAFRVLLAQQGDGTVSALFEDVTESIDLESRFVALTQVQRETLDSLDEGIAVFGTDGLLKLHNPAFVSIWNLPVDSVDQEPHIEEVIGWCRALYDDDTIWSSLRAVVTSLFDSRENLSSRLERPDRSIVDLRAVPLPDGATLVVFTDVSDSARIERALRDRNEALMTAARIKNEFVHKVSYELRAPLTNIIGFAQLMSDGDPGALSEQQREYAGYILSSSSALLAIINDILDLATIDAGVMELDISDVDIASAVTAATESLRDRLKESKIKLQTTISPSIGIFEADEKRIRQILFNLLSNAIGFSEPGQTVKLECSRTSGDWIVFRISDNGRGIPDDVRRTVFDRFESHSLGTRHRGAGLGLSVVKSFVELHGGAVELDSQPGRGTTVSCTFPAQQKMSDAGTGSLSPTAENVFELDVTAVKSDTDISGAPSANDARPAVSDRKDRR